MTFYSSGGAEVDNNEELTGIQSTSSDCGHVNQFTENNRIDSLRYFSPPLFQYSSRNSFENGGSLLGDGDGKM